MVRDFFLLLNIFIVVVLQAQQNLLSIEVAATAFESIKDDPEASLLTPRPWDNPSECPQAFTHNWNPWVDTFCLPQINLPFSFKIFDEEVSQDIDFITALVLNGGGLALKSDNYLLSLSPADLDAGDRGVIDTAEWAVSEIIYRIVGDAPNREFIVEWNSVSHFAECCTRPSVSILHGNLSDLTYQIRLRESDNSFVFHYGELAVQDDRIFTLGGWSQRIAPWILVARNFESQFDYEASDSLHVLTGSPISPVVVRKNVEQLTNFDDANLGLGLDEYPASGTIYIFRFDSTTAIPSQYQPLVDFSVYPSPAKDVLLLKGVSFDELLFESLEIIGFDGQVHSPTTLLPSGAVDIATLPKGAYALSIVNKRGTVHRSRFIKH